MRTPDDSARFYSAPELAAILGMTKQTIYSYARDGYIPGALRIGRKTWRFRRDLVDTWMIATNKVTFAAPTEAANARDA